MNSIPHLLDGRYVCNHVRSPRKDPIHPACNYYHHLSMGYAETCAIFLIPAGGQGTCRVLWYPVGLFRRSRTDLSFRKAELFTWLRWFRKFSGIADDEMVMGFPAEMLPEIVDAVKIITRAPGSKKIIIPHVKFFHYSLFSAGKYEYNRISGA